MSDLNLKHILWAVTIFLSIFLICATILKVAEHPYTIRFEIDNNTLEAVKSINWTAVNQKGYENRCFVNDIEIPCSNFTGDEHFCKDGICRMNGVCPGTSNMTVLDCLNQEVYHFVNRTQNKT